jgi:hypothetical protein
MKTTLSDFVIAFLDLMEAEGRTLKTASIRVGWGMAFIILATVFILVASSSFLWGVYQLLITVVSPPSAAMLISLFSLVLAAVAAVIAKKVSR